MFKLILLKMSTTKRFERGKELTARVSLKKAVRMTL